MKSVSAADLQAVVVMAHHEADTGAPGGMVAVYVELALRHLISGHGGFWSRCSSCHDALGQPWPDVVAEPHYMSDGMNEADQERELGRPLRPNPAGPSCPPVFPSDGA